MDLFFLTSVLVLFFADLGQLGAAARASVSESLVHLGMPFLFHGPAHHYARTAAGRQLAFVQGLVDVTGLEVRQEVSVERVSL